MLCKLCGLEKNLCKSHIIPEFFYARSYDKLHTIHMFQAGDPKPSEKNKVQKGLRDRLLCTDCERFINDKYEKPFKLEWYDKPTIPMVIPPKRILTLKINPELLRGLLLSVLWRVSVSSLEQYKDETLGGNQEKIKNILMGVEDPNPDQYQIITTAVVDEMGHVIHDLVVFPVKMSINDHLYYAMIFGGVQWWIKVSTQKDDKFTELYMANDGTIQLETILQNNCIAMSKFYSGKA